jgi:HPt (histidine-containing phosphotransfer) domain-containing protein
VTETSSVPEGPILVRDLFQRIDGDRLFLSELLQLLREDSVEQIRTAREAIAKGNAAALQRVGHALRGALANLAAPTAAAIAGQLESEGKSGDISSAAVTLSAFEDELPRVIASLEALCMEAIQ